MAKHLEMSIEKEREYFSGELHDLVGQSLTGLKMDIDAILMTRPKDECSMKFKEVVTRLNDLIKTVQNITATVRPMMLRGKGLKQNIEWYISEFERRSKMEVFENIDYSVDLPQDVVICVIRILQESLTNIIRHSKATQVGIMIKRSGDWLHMTVSDNGVGITDEQKNSQDSSGIIIMNERVSTLGGRFHITTEDKLGTKINIQFPLKQQKL
jgi:signal transduction histidine kinase